MRMLDRNSLNNRFKVDKRVIMLFAFLVSMTVSVFAAPTNLGEITALDQWGVAIVSLFTSTWLKAVCVIALIGICLGMVTLGRQEPGMFKKFIPWLVGVIILLSATQIVSFFFEGADLTSGLKV